MEQIYIFIYLKSYYASVECVRRDMDREHNYTICIDVIRIAFYGHSQDREAQWDF